MDGPKAKAATLTLQVTLMDYNKGKTDFLIGSVIVPIKLGVGKVKAEIPSRCPSSAKPHVSFRCEVPPRMYFNNADCANKNAEEWTFESSI